MNRAQAKRRSTAAAETLANRQAIASSRPGSPADAAERVASPQGAPGETVLTSGRRRSQQEWQTETRRRPSAVLSEMRIGRSGRSGRPVGCVRPVVQVQTLRSDVLRQPSNLIRCHRRLNASRVWGFTEMFRDGQSASQPGARRCLFRAHDLPVGAPARRLSNCTAAGAALSVSETAHPTLANAPTVIGNGHASRARQAGGEDRVRNPQLNPASDCSRTSASRRRSPCSTATR